jgi:hypothetical protein
MSSVNQRNVLIAQISPLGGREDFRATSCLPTGRTRSMRCFLKEFKMRSGERAPSIGGNKKRLALSRRFSIVDPLTA